MPAVLLILGLVGIVILAKSGALSGAGPQRGGGGNVNVTVSEQRQVTAGPTPSQQPIPGFPSSKPKDVQSGMEYATAIAKAFPELVKASGGVITEYKRAADTSALELKKLDQRPNDAATGSVAGKRDDTAFRADATAEEPTDMYRASSGLETKDVPVPADDKLLGTVQDQLNHVSNNTGSGYDWGTGESINAPQGANTFSPAPAPLGGVPGYTFDPETGVYTPDAVKF